MAKYKSLVEAMEAGDELAEVEIRYAMLAEVFEASPNLRGNLNTALERAKVEIGRLRAAQAATVPSVASKVVPFDSSRFRRSGEAG